MRVLISGAGGFIGHELITELKKYNFEIYTLGRRKVMAADKHFYWTLGMGLNPESLEEVSWIIHLAWDSTSRRSENYHLNIGGTGLLLESARQKEIPVLIVSSFACLKPISVYGKAKLDIELLNRFGINLRVGKIVNRYTNLGLSKKSFRNLPLIPSPKNVNVHVAYLDELTVFVRNLLKPHLNSQTIVFPSHVYSFRSFLQKFHGVNSFEIPDSVFNKIITNLEKTRIPFLKQIGDQWKSVYSTSQVT